MTMRGADIGLGGHEQAGAAHHHEQRVEQLAQDEHALGPAREQLGGVEHEGELHHLRGLELERARARSSGARR